MGDPGAGGSEKAPVAPETDASAQETGTGERPTSSTLGVGSVIGIGCGIGVVLLVLVATLMVFLPHLR